MALDKEALMKDLDQQLYEVSRKICMDMRKKIIWGFHIESGNLLASIRHEEIREGDTISSYIFADAKNPMNGAEYAEFLELGTGAAHGRPGGREGYWRYKDAQGRWHTTNGMDADPFIAPSVEANKESIEQLAGKVVYDLEKYWKLKSEGGDAD